MGELSWATEAPRAPGAWLQQVEASQPGEGPRDKVPDAERAHEYLIMGLRLTEGIDLSRYAQMAGEPINASKINNLLDLKMLAKTATGVATTAKGRLVLNAVIRELAA